MLRPGRVNVKLLVYVFLCLQEYPDQALLLLVTGALGLRILHTALSPALPVLNTLKVNV